MLSFQDSTDITVVGCTEPCPKCGKQANVHDGTYDFVGRVLTAVRAPGVMKEDVEAFLKIAKDVQSGKVSNEDAAVQISQINDAFAALWKWMNDSGAAIGVILMVLTLYVTIMAKESADAGSERLIQVQEQIYEAVHSQSSPVAQRAEQSPPTLQTPSLPPAQKPKLARPGNRKERRAAAARARHHSPS